MPNRVLRDWTNSERFDKLSAEAEVFFARLIMKADDFGGFYGNTKLLKSHLYPLKDFKHTKIEPWILECASIGIIIYYEVEKKKYVRINDFGQRTRIMRSKFPDPPSCDGHVTVMCPSHDGLKPNQTETETETKPKRNDIERRKLEFSSTLEPFLQKYGRPLLKEFADYWTEPNKSNTKFRQELETTWSLERRLSTWAKYDNKFNSNGKSTQPIDATERNRRDSEARSKRIMDKLQKEIDADESAGSQGFPN